MIQKYKKIGLPAVACTPINRALLIALVAFWQSGQHLRANTVWGSGTPNTVNGSFTLGCLEISGDTHTVTGLDSGGVGTLTIGTAVNPGQLSFTGTGNTTLNITSDNTAPGTIRFRASNPSGIVFSGTGTATGLIASTGTGTNAGRFDLNGSTRTFAFADAAGSPVDMTISASIRDSAGAGGVTKTGLGTLVLSGPNTYAGSTSVTAGTLLVNGDQSAASGAITVAAGATLGGTGTLGGLVTTIQDSATLAPGASAGTLTTTGSAVFSPTSNLLWELNGTDTTIGGGVNDLFTGITTLTLDGTIDISETTPGSFLAASAGSVWRLMSYSGALTDNTLTLGTTPAVPSGFSFGLDTSIPGQVNLTLNTPVPEPATGAFLAFALAAGARRRRW